MSHGQDGCGRLGTNGQVPRIKHVWVGDHPDLSIAAFYDPHNDRLEGFSAPVLHRAKGLSCTWMHKRREIRKPNSPETAPVSGEKLVEDIKEANKSYARSTS